VYVHHYEDYNRVTIHGYSNLTKPHHKNATHNSNNNNNNSNSNSKDEFKLQKRDSININISMNNSGIYNNNNTVNSRRIKHKDTLG
jgi:hypothetical protein